MNLDLNDKTLMYGLVAACVAVFLTFAIIGVGSKVLIDKTTDAVIEKLQRYTPGPYSPAFDPDKVDPNFWNTGNAQPSESDQTGQTRTSDNPWEANWTDLRS